MALTVGQRLASTVCATEVIVLRADSSDVQLTCGDALMVDVGSAEAHRGTLTAEGEGTAVGKRYTSGDSGVEVLCTKPGDGGLAVDGAPLTIKAAKALPSSD